MVSRRGLEIDASLSSPRRPTKIAVLIGTLEVGGAELDIVRNFPRLNRDEFEVVVVCFAGPGTLAPEIEQQGIRVVARSVPSLRVSGPAPWRLVRRTVYAASVIRWIGRTLNTEDPDVVHFFLPHSYGYGMLACMLWRVRAKRVMSRLSLNFYSRGHRILSWLERNVFHRRLDIAIGNSKLILDELAEEGVPEGRLRLLYNGVDTARFAPKPGGRERARAALGIPLDAFVMVAVGNLHTYKGHADLLEACVRVGSQMPAPWRLLVAGRDQEGNRTRYQEFVEERGLAGSVSFLGEHGDIPLLLAAADLFVQPSHHEGLPNALLEAMAAGLPVVATEVGGMPEAVKPEPPARASSESRAAAEATGWLVPSRSPEALAAALLEAAEGPERRAAMGARARQRAVVDFSLEKSVATYEAIYRELEA